MSAFFAKSTIGQPFIELSEVDSTNIYAMDHLKSDLAAHGMAFFAHHQSAGKGQQGKSWFTRPGENITLSVVLDCSFLSITRQFSLSVMVSLACMDLLKSYSLDETTIKWPNDIYWRDRKTGGILIENLLRGSKWQWAVAGIGLNLNQVNFPESLHNPVSLKQITGKHFEPVMVAKELCVCLDKRYTQLKNNGDAELFSEYQAHLYKKGEEVKLRSGPIAFNCIIRSVSETGELLVSDGLKESFRFGEVEWII